MWVCSIRNSVHNAFATIHLFRDFFARNFKYRLVQREWDILTVCIVRYSPDQGYSATICQHANQNAPRVPLYFICKTHHRLDFISIGRWKQCASWCLTNEARGYPGSILVCVLTNRCWVPLVGWITYYANRENVPFTLDEPIIEVASEAISK